MSYLLYMERWHLTYEQLCNTPQSIIDDMTLVMEAEHKVEQEPNARK